MPLPSTVIQTMVKAVAWHAEITHDEAGMRDYLAEHYPHASPYQRRRALELATQAIGVGLRLRELNPNDPLRAGLNFERAPAPEVGVRVRLSTGHMGTRPGFSSPAPQYMTFYVSMSWDQTVGEVMDAIRVMLSIHGYTDAEIAPVTFEFVGPTLFPIPD